jgi:hypothetical protein
MEALEIVAVKDVAIVLCWEGYIVIMTINDILQLAQRRLSVGKVV